VHAVIDGKLADLNRNIEQVEHGNAVMALVREMLEDYESDEQPPQRYQDFANQMQQGFRGAYQNGL
jgi:hypothetical protein